MNKIIFLFCSVIFLFSCQEEVKKDTNFGELTYLVTDYVSINDSTLPEKYIEYFAYIKMHPKKIKWKKIFFKRKVNSLNDKGFFYLQDSIFVNYSLNQNYTVRKIENWSILLKKIKSYYSSYMDDLNSVEIEKIKNFEYIVFDSSLIAQKNTRDIELFNQGLHYLKNENTFQKMGFKKHKETDIIILRKRQDIASEELENYFTLFSDLAKKSDATKIKTGYFDISYEVYPKNNSILSAELSITIISNKLDTIKNVLKMELNKY